MSKLFAFFAGALLALSACSGDGDSDSGSGEAPAANSGEAASSSTATAAPSAEAGEAIFGRCMACHRIEPGQNWIGPTMAGVVGRDVASVAGFNYSPAMAELGGTWTPERLSALVENPRTFVPGSRMAFAGIPDAGDRADLIAYLETL
ncbi:c-type cytochrome [uncultured Parasphingopyxis sp.]|uniref:c-type cytochrome n=1 Tax=uncultured Parasphingopyxis sp. TaxID=1547918 RepID=UPI00261F26DE|nr:c-type cytochrome [uncultured Parasphingopyxis sp.]